MRCFLLAPALAVLGLWLTAADAARGEVWRLAGTMNGWSATDPAWTMEPAGPDAWVLEKRLEPGSFRFKFVRDGAWSAGHLGAAEGGGGALEQPGGDIEVRVDAEAVYRFRLEPGARRWSMGVADIAQPVLVPRVLSMPVAGRSFVLDLSRSLFPAGSEPVAAVRAEQAAEIEAVGAPGDLRFEVTPERAGPLTLMLEVEGGGQRVVQPVTYTVQRGFVWEYKGGPSERTLELYAVADGVARFMINNPMRRLVFDELRVREGDRVLAEERDVFIGKGPHAVEVRDGELVMRDAPEGESRIMLPGGWHEFTFEPEGRADAVFLTGDFNDWAGVGDGAIPVAPRGPGLFGTIAALPDGGHRYTFLVDGEPAEIEGEAGVRTPWGTGARVARVGRGPDDFAPPAPDNVRRSAVRHNPALERDFDPIEGSLGLFDLSVTTLPDDVERVTAIVERDGSEPLRVPMRRGRDLMGFDRFSARVMAGSPSVRYRFELVDGEDEAVTPEMVGEVTPELDLPAWAMGAVWYQIFPERYRNANPANDPHGPGVYATRWTSDWYETQPGEEAQWRRRAGFGADDALPERTGGELFHWVWDRRYGGDLQGIEEKLGELADLGVTALYLNPVFEAESMHKYDATDFRHIDDNFGSPDTSARPPARFEFVEGETTDPETWTWTEADRYFVEEFLPAARSHGIRVVIDGVFNHSGREFWAFRDVVERGEASPYADWFFAEFDEEGNLEAWRAWDGPSGWLPKFRQTDDGNLVFPIRKHIFDITRRWMDPDGDGDPSDGVDGWRLDVPLDIGLPFWEQWRDLVKSINPDAVIIAEIWHDASEYLRGEHFDAQMNYPFADAVLDWLAVEPGMTSGELGARLESVFSNEAQTDLLQQNLYASHDTDRYVSMLMNPGRGYDQRNRAQDVDGAAYVDERPGEDVYRLSVLGVAIQATYLGAPMVYYGDEYGMWGADDPTNRKPLPWPELEPFDNPEEHAVTWLRDAYAAWLGLRGDERLGPVLRYGGVAHLETGRDDVFAFERRLNGDRVVVVVNRGGAVYDASGLLPAGAEGARVGGVEASYWFIPAE